MTKTKNENAPIRVRSGMGENGLAFVLIKNQTKRTPWYGDKSARETMRQQTVDHIIDLRAHGLTERDVIANARKYVADWFARGSAPMPYGNPAVHVLAHIGDEYPLMSKRRFVSILTGRGYYRADAAKRIADAENTGMIKARRTKDGVAYVLTHEPRTRVVCDLLERVAAMMPRHPFGIPIRTLRKIATAIAGGGMMRGTILIERALNADVIRAEDRGGERFYFPNLKMKGISC